MSLLTIVELLFALAVFGVLIGLFNKVADRYMPHWAKVLINIVAIVGAFLVVMYFFGVWDYLASVHVGGPHGHHRR